MNGPADDPLFIGWADTPPRDRRFFLRAGAALVGGSAGLGFGVARLQRPPGPGQWDPDDVREWRGLLLDTPYPMLRLRGSGDEVHTALLSCLGKCGVAARLGPLAGRRVVVSGSLIQRGRHRMISVDEVGDWIRPDDSATVDPALALPAPEPLGTVRLSGEVLDSKCWFGAMRPSSGLGHRGCAALCIRGGIPPAFFARGRNALMVLTQAGRAHGNDLLPLVGVAVDAEGTLSRRGDLLLWDVPVARMRRA